MSARRALNWRFLLGFLAVLGLVIFGCVAAVRDLLNPATRQTVLWVMAMILAAALSDWITNRRPRSRKEPLSPERRDQSSATGFSGRVAKPSESDPATGEQRPPASLQRGVVGSLARASAVFAVILLSCQVVIGFLGAVHMVQYLRGTDYHTEMSVLMFALALLLVPVAFVSIGEIYEPHDKWGIKLGLAPSTIVGLVVLPSLFLGANLISVVAWVRIWIHPVPAWLFGVWFSPPILLALCHVLQRGAAPRLLRSLDGDASSGQSAQLHTESASRTIGLQTRIAGAWGLVGFVLGCAAIGLSLHPPAYLVVGLPAMVFSSMGRGKRHAFRQLAVVGLVISGLAVAGVPRLILGR
jgi:hypothetical protein